MFRGSNFKDKSRKQDEYLDFIRSQPCCSCLAPAPSDPHHFGPKQYKSKGMKISDFRTVPLCRACHDEYHRSRAVPRLSMIETKLLFFEEQTGYLIEWIKRDAV